MPKKLNGNSVLLHQKSWRVSRVNSRFVSPGQFFVNIVINSKPAID